MTTSQNSWHSTGRTWSGTATTTAGVATFYPTLDGTGSGAALFGAIRSVHVNGELNTAVMTNTPICAVKAIAADRTSITVNVFTGTILGVLGATVLAAPDGTVVHGLVTGS